MIELIRDGNMTKQERKELKRIIKGIKEFGEELIKDSKKAKKILKQIAPDPVKFETDEEELANFKKACNKFTKKACKSKKSARKALVELGTHTKSGKLTKNYR